MSDGAVTVLVAITMAVGIVGTVVPVLPGLALVWAAAFVYGLLVGFGAVGVAAFAAITLIGGAGMAAGAVLPHRAAGASGATPASVWIGSALGVVGFFVVPLVGLPLGVVVGLFGAELVRTRDLAIAWASTWATLKAFGLAAIVQTGAGLAMAGSWAVWVVAG